MEEILAKITDFADTAHGEQQRKYSPDRYIVHPKRVMEKLRTYTDDITILSAALLHDVLEDTPVSSDEMLNFLQTLLPENQAKRVLNLVVDLSDVYVKKDFPKLNRKARKTLELERLAKTSPDSQTIKYADIIDNTLEISDEDPSFAKVYLDEVSLILKKLDRGNPELHPEATEITGSALKKLGNVGSRR